MSRDTVRRLRDLYGRIDWQEVGLRTQAIPQLLHMMRQRGLDSAERLAAVAHCLEALVFGHLTESDLNQLDMTVEDMAPDVYWHLDSCSAKGFEAQCLMALNAMKSGSPKAGYLVSFIASQIGHFKRCKRCRTDAYGMMRSAAAEKRCLSRMFDSLPEVRLSDAALRRIWRNVERELDS